MKRRTAMALMLAMAGWLPATDVPARQTTSRAERAVVTTLVAQARKALFEDSQLERARQLAQAELRQNPSDVEALFIEMEAAALEGDTASEFNAALALCELRGAAQRDARVTIAAARVLELAANTEDFRKAIPRIQALLRAPEPHLHAAALRAALLAAAADGAPNLNIEKVAREAGVMTQWRVAGPYGRYGNLEFDQHWAPEQGAKPPAARHDKRLDAGATGGAGATDARAVERLYFADGNFQLPGYFGRNGVFYAAGEITAGGSRILRVESPGTLEVLVDGAVVLRKDDRFRATPEIAWRSLRLTRGTHRVVVKFLASAAPFRVTLMAETAITNAGSQGRPLLSEAAMDYAPEAAYVAAAKKYWAGDYNGVISDPELSKARSSAMGAFLLYHAWTHVADDSPESAALLNGVLQAAPGATAADYELAARSYAADRIDEALTRLRRVITARENFLPAQELMAQISIRLNWPVQAEKALEFQLRVHPSCDVMLREYKFFLGHARYERAHEVKRRLADCAPDTLAYVQTLSESGEHEKAAQAAEASVSRNPLDRGARELLIRELASSGELEKARSAAQELAALAPNSDRYRQMAKAATRNPETLLDAVASPAWRDGFYSKYRRDGVAMVERTRERKFSGGPAVVLVDDRVARLGEDGSVSLYLHKLTRVLDRDGIEKYGEASIPAGAEVLELRTIKADGTVVEPELTPHKATVSMPALAAGDAIDQEYVVDYPSGGIAQHGDAFRHDFGSFTAPILYSRFVAITPAGDAALRAESSPGLAARTEIAGKIRVLAWEKDDIPQSVEEVATARGEVLSSARVQAEFRGGWNDVRERFQDELIDALRAGPRVQQAAARVRAQEPQARAREIFRSIANTVHPAGTFDPSDMRPAEATLAAHAGSRTIAVLAVARAAGLEAGLVLARNAGTMVRDARASVGLYTRPLVKFRFADGREIFADAETEGLAFGAVPPTLERRDALLVTAARENQPPAALPAMVALPANVEEQSVAQGDITLEEDGSLRAEVTIRLGAWRGAQMRSILAGIEPGQRGRYYEQLALRIFAGADNVTGAARNERDPDRPLEIVLRCRAPRYVNLAGGAADMDQLVPTLGLRKMYPGAARKFPLYIDTPLAETARFRLHLPSNVSIVHGAPELNVNGAFGSYSLSMRQPAPAVLEIQRSFRIPVQVIAPERFGEFSTFAAKIDEAERQRITLERN